MADLVDYRERFANRVRSLREAANLSIERASEQGGISPSFWGEVERNEKEPCLNTIFSFAKGLGISGATLLTLGPTDTQGEPRKQLNSLLDLLTPDQVRFLLEISGLIYKQRLGPLRSI